MSTAVREWILRDFEIGQQNVTINRPQPKKWEEDFALHVLTGLKSGLEGGGVAPAEFVYTLGKIGKRAEAVATAVAVAEHFLGIDTDGEWRPGQPQKPETFPPQSPPKPIFPALEWNRVLNSLPDYPAAQALVAALRQKHLPRDVATYTILVKKARSMAETHSALEAMAQDGFAPNVVTYSTLINKADDYEEAKRLLTEMKAAGIPPDSVTYSTLINKAGDYEEAQRLLTEMKAAGIPPNLVTYSTLINKADDYEEAKRLLTEMKAAGIPPNLVTYSSLFSKKNIDQTAVEILKWYYEQAYHPSNPLNALLASFRKNRKLNEALEVALQHPHLDSAQRLMKDFPSEAKIKFEQAKNSDHNHVTADFALGAYYRAIKDVESAQRSLRQALDFAHHPLQKATIEKWLTELSRS